MDLTGLIRSIIAFEACRTFVSDNEKEENPAKMSRNRFLLIRSKAEAAKSFVSMLKFNHSTQS